MQRKNEVLHQMMGHERAYYLADRSFSLPELKMPHRKRKKTSEEVFFSTHCAVGKADELNGFLFELVV